MQINEVDINSQRPVELMRSCKTLNTTYKTILYHSRTLRTAYLDQSFVLYHSHISLTWSTKNLEKGHFHTSDYPLLLNVSTVLLH